MRRVRGFNLIELMVGLAIFSLLLAYALPSFNQWLQSSRIRTTAEAVLAGLQTAKAEAVARNQRVRFQLTSTLDGACVIDPPGRNWVVNLDPDADDDVVEGDCDSAPSDTVAPRILQTRPAGEGSGTAVVATNVASLVFQRRRSPGAAGGCADRLLGHQSGRRRLRRRRRPDDLPERHRHAGRPGADVQPQLPRPGDAQAC